MLKGAAAAHLAPYAASRPDFPWRGRAWLLQNSVECELGADVCSAEVYRVLTLLIGLSICILAVVCLFNFFREDRDDQITPLCPQMVVNVPSFMFKLQLTGELQNVAVLGADDKPINEVLVEYPAQVAGGVVAQVRLLDMHSKTLATVAARDMGAGTRGLALQRGPEIFGFVEPEGDVYHVRHRTGVHLLTLTGDFDDWDVVGINVVDTKVCSFRKTGDECRGFVMEQVDSGLVIASLLAIHMHRHLQVSTVEEDGASPPVTAMFGAPPLEGDALDA